MNRTTPEMRNFAERIIVYEARMSKSSVTKIPVAFLVVGKLHPHLATLMGNVGFRALLARSLTLASAEVPGLRAVHVKSDGTFDGLDAHNARIDQDKISKSGVVLLAQLLGLLVTFIGEILTLQLVLDIWPNLAIKDLNFGNGDKNEKAK